MLRKSGETARKATKILDSETVAFKKELLFQNGINFNELPAWQHRGVGLYWEEYQKQNYNPIEEEETLVTRHRIKIHENMPIKDEYTEFLRRFLNIE
jgi:tRNA(His) 5'-end guanylyltransferase